MNEGPVITGEEEDATVLSLHAKLFKFENTKDWKEKGTGNLRLNMNKQTNKYRLIMRTDGTMKLILNMLLFPKMSTKKQNDKSLVITGLDETGQLGNFLIRVGKTDTINALLEKIEYGKNS